jgi:hypothetical protein
MAGIGNRVGVGTATLGAGTITLGAALGAVAPNLASFQSLASAGIANNQTVNYLILDANGNWEVGIGLNAGGTLTRTPLWSSNSNAAISLSGNAQVFITAIAEDLGQVGYGWRNRFRNGTMDIWQRGTTAFTPGTAGATVSDGWIVTPAGAPCTAQQAGGRLLTSNSLQVVGATGVTGMTVKQRLEGSVAVPFAAQTVTVQAQVLNNTGGTIAPALTIRHANAVDNWSAATTDVSAVSLQSCPNGQWTQLGYAFSASAAAGNGLEVTFDFGNNFSTNGKSIQITECDIRVTPGVQVGLNGNPPPPELRPIGPELFFNQRYFYGIFPNLINGVVGEVGQAFSATASAISVRLPAPMRATPTMTISAPGDFAVLNAGGSAVTATAVSLAVTSWAEFAALSFTVASGLVAGNAVFVVATGTSARVSLSAEL